MKKKDRKKVLAVFRIIRDECTDKKCESGLCPHLPEGIPRSCHSTYLCDTPYLWKLKRINKWLKEVKVK